jgi:hypothetical protein
MLVFYTMEGYSHGLIYCNIVFSVFVELKIFLIAPGAEGKVIFIPLYNLAIINHD